VFREIAEDKRKIYHLLGFFFLGDFIEIEHQLVLRIFFTFLLLWDIKALACMWHGFFW
jgi:hypothetical protein